MIRELIRLMAFGLSTQLQAEWRPMASRYEIYAATVSQIFVGSISARGCHRPGPQATGPRSLTAMH